MLRIYPEEFGTVIASNSLGCTSWRRLGQVSADLAWLGERERENVRASKERSMRCVRVHLGADVSGQDSLRANVKPIRTGFSHIESATLTSATMPGIIITCSAAAPRPAAPTMTASVGTVVGVVVGVEHAPESSSAAAV